MRWTCAGSARHSHSIETTESPGQSRIWPASASHAPGVRRRWRRLRSGICRTSRTALTWSFHEVPG